MSASNPTVTWQCPYCRRIISRAKSLGRPDMHTCSANKGKPHRWIKIREQ